MNRWPGRLVKRSFDILVSALLLLLLSPLMLLIAVVLGLQGGPIIFSHQRVGQGGRLFPCYKFRSMVPNAEECLKRLLKTFPALQAEWERERKLKYDPRVTRLGAFLRRTSLDELPQLFNVLRGEMSLVGPRPVVREELEKYGSSLVYYLMVKPGITGLWQVSGRNDINYRHRVKLDSLYVKKWSPASDFSILFKTVGVVLGRSGAY